MKHIFSDIFLSQLAVLPAVVRKKFEKQLKFLLQDIRYPSLRAKKYDEKKGIWQARVDDDVRFYFTIRGDTYILHGIKKHSD